MPLTVPIAYERKIQSVSGSCAKEQHGTYERVVTPEGYSQLALRGMRVDALSNLLVDLRSEGTRGRCASVPRSNRRESAAEERTLDTSLGFLSLPMSGSGPSLVRGAESVSAPAKSTFQPRF